jgi:hypothetical protein
MADRAGTRISFEVEDEYLRVTIAGTYPSDTIRDLLLAIRSKAEECARTRVLLDAWSLSPPPLDFDRFVLGETAAEIFRSRYRVAVVYRPELINRFAENVARNRGASVLVTASEVQALEWLMR